MRCVSYTRATSGMVNETLPADTIQQQNAAIQQFIKAKGWKLQKKYCDRSKEKQSDTAFQTLKADGIAYRFDYVVAYSAYTLAPTVFLANDLLQKIFVPIQINFAVVEDDFCSAEHSPKEITEYLNAKVKASKDRRLYQAATIFYNQRSTQKFGYTYDATIDNFTIVEAEAKIIRKIYQMRADGVSRDDISKELKKQGVEGPLTQCRKRLGLPLPARAEHWTSGKLSYMLDCKLYSGNWIRTVRGQPQAKECPAIVSAELAKKAREVKKHYNRGHPCTKHEFVGLLVDADTEYPLGYYILPRTREPVIRFIYPKPTPVVYDTMWMRCNELMIRVKAELLKQRNMAITAKEMLATEAGQQEKNARKKVIQAAAQQVFARLQWLESEDVSLRQQTESGAMPEQQFAVLHEENRTEFQKLENQLAQYMEQMQVLETAFSNKNPWIMRYENLDLRKKMSQTLARKLIRQIRCVRFESVNMIPQEKEWFDKLPSTWFLEVEEWQEKADA